MEFIKIIVLLLTLNIIEYLREYTLNDALRTAEVYGRELDEQDPWGPCLSSSAYAIPSTFHTTLKATPGQLVFGRDMVITITFVADWGGG
jgi:hypothetical protein